MTELDNRISVDNHSNRHIYVPHFSLNRRCEFPKRLGIRSFPKVQLITQFYKVPMKFNDLVQKQLLSLAPNSPGTFQTNASRFGHNPLSIASLIILYHMYGACIAVPGA